MTNAKNEYGSVGLGRMGENLTLDSGAGRKGNTVPVSRVRVDCRTHVLTAI